MSGYIKNENFYVIQGWMMNELKLKGNDLGVYAIIYGFTQTKNASYSGSLCYLAEFLNVDKRTIQNALKRLLQKNLIEKQESRLYGVKRCTYMTHPRVQGLGKEELLIEETEEEENLAVQEDMQNAIQAGKMIANVVDENEAIANAEGEKNSIPDMVGEKNSIPNVVGEKNSIPDTVDEKQEKAISAKNHIEEQTKGMEKKSIPDIVGEKDSIPNIVDLKVELPTTGTKLRDGIVSIHSGVKHAHPTAGKVTKNRERSMENKESSTKNFHGGMEKFSTNNIKDNKDKRDNHIYQSIKEIFEENIDYVALQYDSSEKHKGLMDEILTVMLDAYCSGRDTLNLNATQIPIAIVQAQMMKISKMHIEYVLHCLSENTTKIHNIRAYLLTAIYNAPNTINAYYQTRVQHDLYGQRRE